MTEYRTEGAVTWNDNPDVTTERPMTTPRPDALTEHTHPESIPPCPACERAARADAERELAALREALEDLADGIENEGLRAKVRALAKEEGS